MERATRGIAAWETSEKVVTQLVPPENKQPSSHATTVEKAHWIRNVQSKEGCEPNTSGGSGIFALPPFYACVYMEPNTNGSRVNTGLDS